MCDVEGSAFLVDVGCVVGFGAGEEEDGEENNNSHNIMTISITQVVL